jgi:hypothetical protein
VEKFVAAELFASDEGMAWRKNEEGARLFASHRAVSTYLFIEAGDLFSVIDTEQNKVAAAVIGCESAQFGQELVRLSIYPQK